MKIIIFLVSLQQLLAFDLPREYNYYLISTTTTTATTTERNQIKSEEEKEIVENIHTIQHNNSKHVNSMDLEKRKATWESDLQRTYNHPNLYETEDTMKKFMPAFLKLRPTISLYKQKLNNKKTVTKRPFTPKLMFYPVDPQTSFSLYKQKLTAYKKPVIKIPFTPEPMFIPNEPEAKPVDPKTTMFLYKQNLTTNKTTVTKRPFTPEPMFNPDKPEGIPFDPQAAAVKLKVPADVPIFITDRRTLSPDALKINQSVIFHELKTRTSDVPKPNDPGATTKTRKVHVTSIFHEPLLNFADPTVASNKVIIPSDPFLFFNEPQFYSSTNESTSIFNELTTEIPTIFNEILIPDRPTLFLNEPKFKHIYPTITSYDSTLRFNNRTETSIPYYPKYIPPTTDIPFEPADVPTKPTLIPSEPTHSTNKTVPLRVIFAKNTTVVSTPPSIEDKDLDNKEASGRINPLLKENTEIDVDVECGIENSAQFFAKVGRSRIETYPWLGSLFYPVGVKRVSTPVVLVTKQLVLAVATEVNKFPKYNFRKLARVVVGHNCRHRGLGILEYNYHPEYRRSTSSSLVIIQLNFTDVAIYWKELHPICGPPKYILEPTFFAKILPDDCRYSAIEILEMDYVSPSNCTQFYRRSGLDIASIWPNRVVCSRGRSGGDCIWADGTVLAVKQMGRWHLMGFGISGPGCESPSRFVDYTDYQHWVSKSMRRMGTPAITRLDTNEVIIRKTEYIQRFGRCDIEEIEHSLYTDSTIIETYATAETNIAQYKLTLTDRYDYSCVSITATYDFPYLTKIFRPGLRVHAYCFTPWPICQQPGFQIVFFEVEVYFKWKTMFKISIYGRNRRIVDQKSLIKYTNNKKPIEVPWDWKPTTETIWSPVAVRNDLDYWKYPASVTSTIPTTTE